MTIKKKCTVLLLLITLFATLFCTVLTAASGEIINQYSEKYNGKIYHIFFHSLIIDTSAAFNSDKKNGYNDWMTTKAEFKAIISTLYAKNFVLIDLTSIADKNADGKVIKKDLYLPIGKKPLVISVDDVNYYDYMKGDGFAERLAVDCNNNVTAVVNKSGVELYDYEGDVVPILDAFVSKHPDFSPYGAKGILAVTGYEGVFGYRTTTTDGNAQAAARKEAAKVTERLKETGWKIACHSYSHSSKFRDGSITIQKLREDIVKWKTNIGAIVGETELFVSPFGIDFTPSDPRFRHLVNQGFYVYCPVYKEMNTIFGKDYLISERLNFDGLTMQTYPERIEKYFFCPASIIDNSRSAVR